MKLKRIEGTWSNQENLEAINPYFGTGDEKYTRNCGHCAVANELRHRGYDVEANPNLTGDGMSIYELAEMFDGATVQEAALLSTTDLAQETIANIEQSILAWGEGARGAIRGEWLLVPDGAPGHLFSVEVRNGEIRYEDGQSGKEIANHLKNMKPRSVAYVRLDNTKPNNNVLNYVKNRRG